jgi:hypothetical protein
LLQKFVPFIEREYTVMRNSIPASQRLSATLRFVAAGQAFEDLKFTTAIEPLVPDVPAMTTELQLK